MAADSINNIIDVSGFDADLGKVITGISTLEAKMQEANSNAIQIIIDSKSLDTLNRLTSATEAQTKAQQDLSGIQQEQISITQTLDKMQQQYASSANGTVKALVEQKQELSYVTEQMKATSDAMKDGSGNMVVMEDRLVKLTKRQLELKVEIGETTSAIKTEIKEINAAAGSMDQLSQTLYQLKEQYRALSAEERNNANIGGVLQQKISQLDLEIKQLDATIGNSQRNVGNYASGFKSVSAELSATKAQMQQMVVAGEKGSAEYAVLSARAKELAASQREVSRETGRAVFSIENVGKRLETMVFRMGMHMIVFTLVIGAITKLIEKFTELSDAEQAAADRAKDLQDSLKSAADSAINLNTNIAIGIDAENNKMQRLVDTYNSHLTTLSGRINAYTELQSMYPNILSSLTDEEKKTMKLTDAHDKEMAKMNEYSKLKISISEIDKTINEEDIAKQKALSEMREMSGNMTPQTKRAIQRGIAATVDGKPHPTISDVAEGVDEGAANKYLDLRDKTLLIEKSISLFKSSQLDSQIKMNNLENAPIVKDKTKKVSAKNHFESELKDEEFEYKKHLAKIQELYDLSNHQMGVDDVNRDEAERATKESHFKIVEEIYKKWDGKLIEDAGLMDARRKQSAADELAINNAINEDERKSALEIQKRHFEENKLIDEKIQKLRDYRAAVEKNARKLQDIKDQSKEHTDYANSGNPFLEALGFNPDFQEEQNDFKRKIAAAKEDLADLQDKRGDAYASGDGVKVGEADVAVSAKVDDIAQLQADQQKAIDDKLIAAKKAIAEQTVRLAQETFAAIKTIRDNEFAAEQQQLQIKMQSINLQYDQQVQAINATTGYQITKDNELAKLAAQHAAEQNAIQQQENNLALRKAKADKQAAEAEILANTAVGIVKALAEYGYAGIPLAALIAATGAVQYAAAASTPLPQYAVGTEGTTSTHFIAGEQGPELMTMPGGKTMLADKPGIYSAPLGTKINTADETAAFMRYAQHSMSLSINGRGELKESVPSMTDKGIIEAIHDSNNEVVNAIYRNRTNVNIRVASDYRVWKR